MHRRNMKSNMMLDFDWRKPAAIVFFMVTSILAVVVNKGLFVNFKFPCPLLATSIQFVIALFILAGMHVFGKFYPSWKTLDSLWVSAESMVHVLPVSLTFLGMVCFNNWFLMQVGVGFYAVGKSLAIPFSVVMSYVVLGVHTKFSSIVACGVISSGVLVSSYFDMSITASGFFLGALSSIFTAAYQIAVKRGLQHLHGDQWKLSLCNSLWVVTLLTPLAFAAGEGPIAFAALFPASSVLSSASASFVSWPLVAALSVSGVTGFLIGQATYLSIHYTSALAHHVTGALKSCLQTAVGIALWSEPATLPALSGLGLTLAGSYGFMRSRMPPPTPPPSRESQV